MAEKPRTILLAGPTLLYTPIFLAKYARLSPVFDHLKLDWEPERRATATHEDSSIKDSVLAALLEKRSDDDVIVAVCDPCRVGYIGDIKLHEPRLLCGLIRKVCLDFCCTRYARFGSDKDVLQEADEIVVNSPEMSSFAITAELLEAAGRKTSNPPVIFHSVSLGMESTEAYAKAIAGRFPIPKDAVTPRASVAGAGNQAAKLIYTSAVSAGAEPSARSRSAIALLQALPPNKTDAYTDFLFSALLTTQETVDQSPELLREIVSAVRFATMLLKADPPGVAEELWQVKELRPMFEREGGLDKVQLFLKRMIHEDVFFCGETTAFDFPDRARSLYTPLLKNACKTHENSTWLLKEVTPSRQFRSDRVFDLLRCDRISTESGASAAGSAGLTTRNPSQRFVGAIAMFAVGAWSVIAPLRRTSKCKQPCEVRNEAEDARNACRQLELGASDMISLSARSLFNVPTRELKSFVGSALTLAMLMGLLFFVTAALRVFRDSLGSLINADFAERWMQFLLRTDHPPSNKSWPQVCVAVAFILAGVFFVILLDRPRRRTLSGHGLFDFLLFVFGMSAVIVGVQGLTSLATAVEVVCAWAALLYAFSRLANRNLPDPVRLWRGMKQRLMQRYEFRRSLWQAFWQATQADETRRLSGEEQNVPTLRSPLEPSDWLSFWIGGPRCRLFAISRLWMALIACCIVDLLVTRSWRVWCLAGVAMFVALQIFRQLTGSESVWGRSSEKACAWLRAWRLKGFPFEVSKPIMRSKPLWFIEVPISATVLGLSFFNSWWLLMLYGIRFLIKLPFFRVNKRSFKEAHGSGYP